MTKKRIIWTVIILFSLVLIFSGDDKKSKSGNSSDKVNFPAEEKIDKYVSRPFHMGFTRWPPDFEVKAIENMYDFIDNHGDLIAHHFDGGIPWQEALDGSKFSNHLMNDWSYSKSKTPRGHKVLVSITPFDSSRKDTAKHWGEKDNEDLTSPWKEYKLNDEHIKTAYLNYANRVIDYFDPDYLAIGIEVNIAITKDINRWNEYKELHRYVYEELKKKHSSLPIFATISLSHLDGLEGGADKNKQRSELSGFMKYNDILTLSAYPYGFAGREEKPAPENMFDNALYFKKKIAISETGAPSREFRSLGFKYSFSEEDQKDYVNFLMRKGVENNFVFIVNWEAIDSDKLLEKFPSGIVRELGKLYAYLGLEKSDGTPKSALAVWDKYLKLPYKK